MAINIRFDLAGNPEPPTIILATRNGSILGQLDYDEESIELIDKLNDASEFTFTIHKPDTMRQLEGSSKVRNFLKSSDKYLLKDSEKLYLLAKSNNSIFDGSALSLWDKVVDFKLAYCVEWDTWFEMTVELDEDTETIKTVFCTQLGPAELSQLMLYDIEINTEDDIARDDYKITILWNADEPEGSLLHRLLNDKAPHYSVIHVDPTIARIQRTFSFDGTSIYDAFQEISEEIGCLFVFPSNLGDDGTIQRTIAVYDLETNCGDCGHRGQFTGVCPECGSTNLIEGYGDDTTIFITADELASSGIQLTTDTDSVKNCFKLEAGDDLMTATIRNCNPNGSDYIWYFSDHTKEDMPKSLVEKIEAYDRVYERYCKKHVTELDSDLLSNYNALVSKYSVYNDELQPISTPIEGYSSLMNAYYNTIDLELFLESALMPSIEMSETSAVEQASLLTRSSLSPVAVQNVNYVSLATANSVVLSMAKTIVKSTYKVEVKDSQLSGLIWRGNFIVTNYSDEEDTAISSTINVSISGDMETFVEQKLEKALNKEDTDDLSIAGLFKKGYDDFCAELKKYALNPLVSFRDACQACLDILIEQGAGASDSDLYTSLYLPYHNKLSAIEAEIKIREDEINSIVGVYDLNGELVEEGIQTNIEYHKSQIQDALDFEKYLGENLWLEFCAYRREDEYLNDNYISDGLNNAELFDKALEFVEVAEKEIFKASELQHSISTNLNNLLAIPKFKVLVDSFELGNWFRIQIDGDVYKLRLLEYTIDYGDFRNIPVEFSDVTKVKNGTTDIQDILEQASSMATSYSSIQRQANKGNNAMGTIDQWVKEGLNTAYVRIQNNNTEDIQITKNGLLCRSYDEVTDTYAPEQLKITHNIMAYTDDDWVTVRQAIGKHDYKIYNDSQSKFIDQTGYGLTADFVVAGIVSGSQIIGGDIYSYNYSRTQNTGSHLNLADGTFSFAGGNLTYDGEYLSVDGKITIAEEGTIGCWSIDENSIYRGSNTFNTVSTMYFGVDGLSLGTDFRVEPDGSAYANNLTITGGSLTVGNKYGDTYASISSDGVLNCKGANIEGEINATSGTIGGCSIVNGVLQIGSSNVDGALSESEVAEIATTITKDTVTTSYVNALNVTAGSVSASDITAGTISGSGIYVDSACISGTLTAGSLKGATVGLLNSSGYTVGEMSITGASTSAYRVELYSNGALYLGSGWGDVYLQAGQSAIDLVYTDLSGNGWNYITFKGDIRPTGDGNSYSCGTSGYKWSEVYASTGEINTSDLTKKIDVVYGLDNYNEFYDSLKPISYKMIDGTSGRTHVGLGAQDVEQQLIDVGLTSFDFAGFIKSPKKNEANEIIEGEYDYGLRYGEFISMNIWQIQRLKERVIELENKVLELEEKMS